MIPGANQRISLAGKHGAGLYGAVSRPAKRCGRCNNGTGIFNPDCVCRQPVRPSSIQPYMEGDDGDGD